MSTRCRANGDTVLDAFKQHLGGRRFVKKDNLKEEVGLKKILLQYQKCIKVKGNYVEINLFYAIKKVFIKQLYNLLLNYSRTIIMFKKLKD